MKAGSRIPRSVDEYIARFPPEVRTKLEKLRQTIHDAASGISEKVSYQMPAFERQGILVWFAAFQKHIGFFPTAEGVAAFKKKLGRFATSKGTVQFPLDAEPPYGLVKDIVKHRVRTNAEKAGARSTKKASAAKASAVKKPTTKKAASRAVAATESARRAKSPTRRKPPTRR